jgi:hypothetical protein
MDHLRNIDRRLDELRDRLFTVEKKDESGNDIIFVKKPAKKLTNAEFHSEDFLKGYTKCGSVDDVSVGDFIRYKQKKEGQPAQYLWGGVVIYKCLEKLYLRVKNPYNKRVWSVQFGNPNTIIVFYVRDKIDPQNREVYANMDPDGAYVNLNTASSEGLIASIINKGDEAVILAAANMIRENNRKTYLI